MAGLIHLLSADTIDKIAAGEVVEKPASVVKELTENAIDAGADKITVEIKEGGISFIRVTDNGCGIGIEDVNNAFLRHATSKINVLEDLNDIESLGFRGEALSSISAVSRVTLTTKRKDDLSGITVNCEGGELSEIKEVGAPDGTTIIVKDLFYNTPARRKFLRTSMTEGSYISELLEHLAMSHPDIAISFIINGKNKFFTSGNGDLSEIIYRIYGKETVKNLIPVERISESGIKITGFLGKSVLARSNRSYEVFFVNGRYIRSKVISQSLEEAYQGFLMQHKYPFAVLHFDIPGDLIDINVHPTKMEIRFMDSKPFAAFLIETVSSLLSEGIMIPEYVAFEENEKKEDESNRLVNTSYHAPEPFEKRPAKKIEVPEEVKANLNTAPIVTPYRVIGNPAPKKAPYIPYSNPVIKKDDEVKTKSVQMELFSDALDNAENDEYTERPEETFNIIGQVFETYWIVEFKDKIYFVDQHAAHEKVNYENWMEKLRNKENPTQMLMPATVITLSPKELQTLLKYEEHFKFLGFEFDNPGGNDIAIRGVPLDLYGTDERDLFLSVLDELTDFPLKGNPEIINTKIASMSCKAAVKGNSRLSVSEAKVLLKKLFSLQNPYHCPHGRPTMFSMSKYEMEKRFKRVI
ncbi:MAG TPA: DNA mismatch repair endonuclease MutL [Lachnospiraceae bacterium]|nr:DNA mismatch repair endonuclease MutL [Lachnospiraceae bacterium]